MPTPRSFETPNPRPIRALLIGSWIALLGWIVLSSAYNSLEAQQAPAQQILAIEVTVNAQDPVVVPGNTPEKNNEKPDRSSGQNKPDKDKTDKTDKTDKPEKIPRAFDRNRPEPEEEVEAPKKNAMVNFAMDPDRWSDVIYSQLGGSETTFEQQQRRRVRSTVNRIELICGIDEATREKVQATAELEIQRFKTEVLALAAQGPRNPTQEEYSEFYNKVFKLTERFRAQAQPPNAKKLPLWQKVLFSNLSEKHKQEIETDNQKRAEYRQQVIRIEVLMRISRRLGLTSKQREKLEPYTASNTEAWKSLDQAWQSLQQFPEKEKRDLFTPEQIQELKKPLDQSDDLQLVIRELGDDL
jgi:hypothetical protein